MMPEKLLDQAELTERTKHPFPRIILYAQLAEAYSWDKETVDRQPQDYLDDLFSHWLIRGKVDKARARRKPSKSNESQWWDGMSDAQIRRQADAPEDMPMDVVNEMIGRVTDDETEEEEETE